MWHLKIACWCLFLYWAFISSRVNFFSARPKCYSREKNLWLLEVPQRQRCCGYGLWNMFKANGCWSELLRLLKFHKLFIEVNSLQGFGCRIHVAALLQAKCHKVYVTVKGTSSLRWIIEKRIGTVRQKSFTVPMPKKIFRAYFTLAHHRSMRRLIALQITVHLPRLIYYISSIVFLGTLIIFIQISTEKIIKTFTRSEEWVIR